MYLSQEYLKRHGLEVRQAVYDETVNLILRSSNFQWLILHGEWRPPTLHPGYYVFQMFKPVHNGGLGYNIKTFEPITEQSLIYWDEFERFINGWLDKCVTLRQRDFIAVESHKEAELVCWEMFLYIFDRWLADNMDSKFFDLVMGSTKPELSFRQRRDSYLYASEMLEEYSTPYTTLQKSILQYAEKSNYSEWLAKLANTNP